MGSRIGGRFVESYSSDVTRDVRAEPYAQFDAAVSAAVDEPRHNVGGPDTGSGPERRRREKPQKPQNGPERITVDDLFHAAAMLWYAPPRRGTWSGDWESFKNVFKNTVCKKRPYHDRVPPHAPGLHSNLFGKAIRKNTYSEHQVSSRAIRVGSPFF